MKRQRIKLNHAVLFDELPSEVKDLFGAAGEMSFSVGNRLRSVQKTIGQPAFIAIARYIRDHREPMITRDLLRAFETVNEESCQGIDIRISVARNGRYLKIESSHLPTLVKDIEKLKSDLMSSLTSSFRRLARTAKAR